MSTSISDLVAQLESTPEVGSNACVATKPQVQSLNHRHEGIMKWLLANPDKTLTECAATHQYTLAWLSTIVHSDAFQAQYRAMQDASYGDVRLDVKAKITGLAHMSLDKLAEQVPASTDPDFVLDVADKTLKALGYGAPSRGGQAAVNVQVNQYQVSPSELAEARRIAQTKGVIIEQPVIEAPIATTTTI